MFPAGMVGVALLVLRVTVAAALLVDGTAYWSLIDSCWFLLLFILTVGLLCLGVLTPYCSGICVLLALRALWDTRGQNEFDLIMFVLISLVTAVLGPGAYSVDARLFGRRLLTTSSRRNIDGD